MDIFYVIILGMAVSMDSFLAGATYGLKKISMPWISLCVAGLTTAVCTAAAMLVARSAGSYINPHVAAAVGSILLLLIGLWNIFQSYLAGKAAPCHTIPNQKLNFRIGRLIISIMADPEAVDQDGSKSISPSEATLLGLALGVDNMAATFAADLLGILPFYTPLAMGLIQLILIFTGLQVSERIFPESTHRKFPYLPGTILVIMGIIRLAK